MEESIKKFGVQVEIVAPEKFLVIKETLTRLGVASNKTKTLYQSCHILHKRGLYFVVHFKELFELDGKSSNISQEDLERRNLIANLLQDWGLLIIDQSQKDLIKASTSSIKILSYNDKDTWECKSKYTVGNKNSY